MRHILNISLPKAMADVILRETKRGQYSSTSEFVRFVMRDWLMAQEARKLKRIASEIKKGKVHRGRSLKDLL